MRPARALVVSVVASLSLLACASRQLHLPPGGFYRVPGLAPTPTPFSSEEGAQSFRLEPGGRGVEVVIEVALVKGEIRLVTAIDNRSRERVRYDLRATAVSAADGTKLVLAGVSEDPSKRPSAAERATEEYRAGVRWVKRGERNLITRRYRLPDPDDPDAARLLGELQLADELGVGEQPEPVRLRLVKVR